MAFSISAGVFDVFESGAVVVPAGASIRFRLDDLTIDIEFHSKEGDAQDVSAEVKENRLVMKLYNFNNPLGSATKDKFDIGTLRGRSLHFSFTVHAIGDPQARTFSYTFWLGAKVG